MAEWNDSERMAQGYELDPNHPANLAERNKLDRQIDKNTRHRESLLPCSGSLGAPLAPKEEFTPRTEVERLCIDREKWARVQELRQLLGNNGA